MGKHDRSVIAFSTEKFIALPLKAFIKQNNKDKLRADAVGQRPLEYFFTKVSIKAHPKAFYGV